jgi:ATP-dependent RNA helicase DHX57
MNAYNGWLAAKADGREMPYCNDVLGPFLSRVFVSVVCIDGDDVADDGDRCRRAAVTQKFLSRPALQAIADLKRQYAELLSEIGFLDQRVSTRLMNKQAKIAGRGSDGVKEATGARLNRNSKNTRVIKAALCCGLYPNVVRISSPETRYIHVIPGSLAQPHNARDLKFYTKDDGKDSYPSSSLPTLASC